MFWNGLELPNNPYYQDDVVIIYHADCRDILPLIPDKSIDLVLTDMPYDDLNFDWLEQCFEILKCEGSCYIVTDYRSVAELKLTLDKLGCFRSWIIWCYRAGMPRNSTRHYIPSHANILFYTKSDDYFFSLPRVPSSETSRVKWQRYADKDGWVNSDKLTPSLRKRDGKMKCGLDAPCPDWWYFPVLGRGNNPEIKDGKHPFQKPVDLIKRMVSASSQSDNLILDPFLGSGTTAYCAKKLGRKCIGIEIEEKYCEIASKRCSQTVMRLIC